MDVDRLLSLVPDSPVIRFDLRDRERYTSDDGICCPSSLASVFLLICALPDAGVDPNNVNGVIQFVNNLEKDERYQDWPDLKAVPHSLFACYWEGTVLIPFGRCSSSNPCFQARCALSAETCRP